MDAHVARPKKKLERSPLLLVLCEIQFAPVLSISKRVTDVQEELRTRGFPGLTASQVQHIQFGDAGPSFTEVPRWVFSSKEQDKFLTLSTSSLSLQVTNYDDFEAFLADFKTGIDAIEKVVNPSFASRIGLRYVDAVEGVGDDASKYFREALHSFTPTQLGVESLLSSQQVVANTEVGHLLIRMNQVKDASMLPPDLNSPELSKLTKAQQGVHVILDIDSSDERQSDFSYQILEQRLWSVHKYSDLAFWNSVTEYAQETWGLSLEGSKS